MESFHFLWALAWFRLIDKMMENKSSSRNTKRKKMTVTEEHSAIRNDSDPFTFSTFIFCRIHFKWIKMPMMPINLLTLYCKSVSLIGKFLMSTTQLYSLSHESSFQNIFFYREFNYLKLDRVADWADFTTLCDELQNHIIIKVRMSLQKIWYSSMKYKTFVRERQNWRMPQSCWCSFGLHHDFILYIVPPPTTTPQFIQALKLASFI